ncbi:hypothetical protein [Spirillospora sp. CA-294931]|uniref:hypothetical protein n=1 Tax=Spirillospora sp. CA-294931 TaxID=3240042 RepID=UPI003D8EA35C
MISLVVRAGLVVVVGLGVVGCGADDKAPAGARSVTQTPQRPAKKVRPVVKVPAGTRVGYAVFDRASGKMVLAKGEHLTFRSASVVKILIALDFLGRQKASAADLAMLRPMLRSSDDKAATAFWARGGKAAIIARMVKKLGLGETAPPPAEKPGFWGYTALSAADVVKTYRYLMDGAPEDDREFVVGNLRKATPCGTDKYDQYFGIPRAVPRPWAVKQGWSGFGDSPAVPCKGTLRPASAPDLGLGRPVLHTTGLVAKERRILVVLSLHPAGTSFQVAQGRLTALTRQVHRASS